MTFPELTWSRGIKFLTAWFCPFAQNTRIVLEEKGVPYALQEAALKDPRTGQWRQFHEKPDWFKQRNPLGKVPVLVVRDDSSTDAACVYESLICNEYLEDTHPEPALLPTSPEARARARIIMDRFASRAVPQFYRALIHQETDSQEQCLDQFSSELHWLESQIHPEGPHFLGSQFTLVDAALLPWFLRLPVLEHFRGYTMPEDVPKLHRWAVATAKRPSATMQHPDGHDYDAQLMDHYRWYAEDKAMSTSAHDFR